MTVTGPARFYGPASALALAGMMWRMGWFWWFPAGEIGTVLLILMWVLIALAVLAVPVLILTGLAVSLLVVLARAVAKLLPRGPQAPETGPAQCVLSPTWLIPALRRNVGNPTPAASNPPSFARAWPFR